jgi:hypothetical protein
LHSKSKDCIYFSERDDRITGKYRAETFFIMNEHDDFLSETRLIYVSDTGRWTKMLSFLKIGEILGHLEHFCESKNWVTLQKLVFLKIKVHITIRHLISRPVHLCRSKILIAPVRGVLMSGVESMECFNTSIFDW